MALISVIIADVWQWTPFIFILALAALQGMPSSALEAARIDGATAWQTTLYIKLPLIMPVIAVAALLRLIDAFKVLEVIYILTEGGPVDQPKSSPSTSTKPPLSASNSAGPPRSPTCC